jgi:hypothetical protein
MRNVLNFIVLSFAMISRAETPASDSIYHQYLVKFGKSIERMAEPARVESFFESVHYIYTYEMSKSISADGASSTPFSLGFNEMTDWLQHEVDSRFSINPGNDSLPLTTVAIDGRNYLISTSNDDESRIECLSDAEKVRRSLLSSEENFEREKIIRSLLEFGAAAPVIDEDGEPKTDGLNWASASNPRGFPVLSTVRNQVRSKIILIVNSCYKFFP